VKCLQRNYGRAALAALSCAALLACQSPQPVPVVERGQPPSNKLVHHVVSSGETLYSIAWKYELDAQRLAAINGLQTPYRLYSGQRLSLAVPGQQGVSPSYGAYAPGGQSAPVKVAPVEESRLVVSSAPVAPAKVEAPAAAPPLPTPPPLPSTGSSSGAGWLWPVKGTVSREYDATKVLKGISIFTDSQTPVMAAAPGVVVYAGDGLRGYGKLIIVKHSDTQLSAYAHNHKILVSENQSVKQGEQIAEVGMDHAGKYRLYFEIRENGKPIDPLIRLPK
jgi:lipoprotein NlpD